MGRTPGGPREGRARRPGLHGPAGLVFPFVLAACAAVPPPKPSPEVIAETRRLEQLSLDHWLQRAARLQRIGQKMRLAGRDLCGRHLSPILGISVVDAAFPLPGLEEASSRRFGEEGVYVVEVFPEMAGARAGLRPGDRILSVDGRLRGASDVYRPATRDVDPIRLEVRRGDEALSLSVEPAQGCEFPIYLTLWEEFKAWADGSDVYIGAALVRQLRRDADLAYLVGHELAHNIHVASGVENPRNRTRAYRIDAESKADYVGIYLSAMAGYPLHTDPQLYVTLTTDINSLGERSRTHPMKHARSLRFAKTLEEIERKRQLGEPLVPSMR